MDWRRHKQSLPRTRERRLPCRHPDAIAARAAIFRYRILTGGGPNTSSSSLLLLFLYLARPPRSEQTPAHGGKRKHAVEVHVAGLGRAQRRLCDSAAVAGARRNALAPSPGLTRLDLGESTSAERGASGCIWRRWFHEGISVRHMVASLCCFLCSVPAPRRTGPAIRGRARRCLSGQNALKLAAVRRPDSGATSGGPARFSM